MIGRDRLHPPYAAFVSTGATRATQMLEILRHAAGTTPRSPRRRGCVPRWRIAGAAAKAAGKRADLKDIRAIDPDLVERESWLLGSALRQVVAGLPEGGRALVVGHSPTTEAAVLGLAGRVVPPLGKGAWAAQARSARRCPVLAPPSGQMTMGAALLKGLSTWSFAG